MDKWEAVINSKVNDLSYSLTSKDGKTKEDFKFTYSPEYALRITYGVMYSRPSGAITYNAFNSAWSLYDVLDFSKRERAIAAAFFELGRDFERFMFIELDIYHTKMAKAPRQKGGQNSAHWMPYCDVITYCLEKYANRKYNNKAEAIEEFKSITGQEPSENTFNYWWNKYRNGKPLFLALEEQQKASEAALRNHKPPNSN